MDFDPYDRELHRDPYPVYRRLRDAHPVYRNDRLDFFALSRWDDVLAALEDPELYISSKGIAVGIGDLGERFTQGVPMLIMMDGDRHARLRKLVSGAFAPRRVAALEPMIRGVARALLDEMGERPDPDLVRDLSGPLPTIVIAELLGVPREDRDRFKSWSNAIAQFDPASPTGAHPAAALGPAAELAGYLGRILDERRRDPGDDLLSVLLSSRVDGASLSETELLGFAFLLLVAGNETTTNLISNAAVLLDRHPDQRRKLLDEPGRIRAAVEEFLRFDPPVQGLARTTTRDVTLHGTPIPKGAKVLLLFASANRDERHIEAPERFEVTRSPNPHLAFGFGQHFCLGSGLARLEARIAFEELLARLPDYRLADPEVERLCSGPIRGAVRLPLAT
jgi:cytochrome P450